MGCLIAVRCGNGDKNSGSALNNCDRLDAGDRITDPGNALPFIAEGRWFRETGLYEGGEIGLLP